MSGGPIFEVEIDVETATADMADWLADYAAACRSDAGIADSGVLHGTAHLVLRLVFTGDEALDEFLSGRAARLEADLGSLSDTPVEIRTRVLREVRDQNLPGPSACLNCGTPLRGQYCGQCGQRSRGRLISLWELITDAFGDLFELDSRLWQTLIPLLLRPGHLTADYLKGKRARFMPPFRTYLVLSLLFFVVAFFDAREDLAILFPDDSPTAEAPAEPSPETGSEAADDEGGSADPAKAARIQLDTDFEPGVRFSFEDDPEGNCDIDDAEIADMPQWIQRRLTRKRLVHICEQTRLDDGKLLGENMLDNVPASLIVLLPIMALALKILYPLSRRYYVEHLLFFVHFHAFFFLILTLQFLWDDLTSAIGLDGAVVVIPIVVLSLYIPVYLFRAMRRVYGQGILLTLLKYLALVVVYIAGVGATMLGALAIAVFSI